METYRVQLVSAIPRPEPIFHLFAEITTATTDELFHRYRMVSNTEYQGCIGSRDHCGEINLIQYLRGTADGGGGTSATAAKYSCRISVLEIAEAATIHADNRA